MAKLSTALLLALALVAVPVLRTFKVDDQDIGRHWRIRTLEEFRGLFEKFDENEDGKVTLQEMMAFASAMSVESAWQKSKSFIDRIDINEDGQVSLDEYRNELSNIRYLNELANQAGNGEQMMELEKRAVVETAKFHAADQDGDGSLILMEIGALFFPAMNPKVLEISVRSTMEMKDKDDDGSLTAKEFCDVPEDAGADVEFLEDERQDFQKLDKDNNGLLDLKELTAWESGIFHAENAMMKLLELSDKDGDMAATLKELENAREELADSNALHHLSEWAEHHEL
mmetsp:Transcript_422/g.752  ORF Transcript_422/g.752 Transcript_422/m.752 type:complete len:285 (+) Transcript_422:91-945(+)